MRLALNAVQKIMLKKYQSLWKCPIGLHLVFLCVCVNLKQTSWRHSPPPISLNPPSKFSLYHVMYLSRGNISRGPPSPQYFKPNKNAGFKSRLCFKRLPHIFAMRYTVGFNFKNWVTENNASVVFKNDLFSITIFYQCCELKSNEKLIFKKEQ